MDCPLCHSPGQLFHRDKLRSYYRCTQCLGIYPPPHELPQAHEERNRYLQHQNTDQDAGYLHFVSPILETVRKHHAFTEAGLDFGSGPNPVIWELLTREGYRLNLYDPFFNPDNNALTSKYSYLICCEVIEHFHQPLKEFTLLYNMLQPGGRLYCMTDLYTETIPFAQWYYKNDFTHVFFYHQKTIQWIRQQLAFSLVQIDHRLITFTR